MSAGDEVAPLDAHLLRYLDSPVCMDDSVTTVRDLLGWMHRAANRTQGYPPDTRREVETPDGRISVLRAIGGEYIEIMDRREHVMSAYGGLQLAPAAAAELAEAIMVVVQECRQLRP